MPSRKGKFSANPEGSRFCQLGRIPFLPIQKFFLHIQKGFIFDNPEGSSFFHPRGVSFLPTRRGPFFANPEGSCFANSEESQSGRVSILSNREGIIRRYLFANPEGSLNADPEGSEFCERHRRDPKYTKRDIYGKLAD